jgi:membrane fusion protein (multidrug efflux system)
VRGEFPNPDGNLLPGQFVRIEISGITLPDAIVIPKQAVSQGPQGPYVFLVGENDVAESRPIRLGPEMESVWVVQDGLKSGDRVVVDGVIRVRPGAAVKPVAVASPPEAKSGGARQ